MAPKEKKRALPGRQDAPTSQVATEDRILRKRTNASKILALGSDRQWSDARSFTAFKLRWLELMAIDRDVPATAYRVASILGLLYINRETGTAWPALATLAAHIGANESTVRRSIEALQKLGYVKKKRGGDGRPNTYEMSISDRAKMHDLRRGRACKNAQSETPLREKADRAILQFQTVQNCTPNPCIEPLLKGDAKASPHKSSVVEIDNISIAAARALRARAQPDQTISTETEYEPMSDDPNDPTFDQDDDPQRPDPDWAPEGEPFHEVPLDPNDDPDDDEPLEPVEVDASFDREPDIVRRFAQVVPDSIRTALRTFIETGVVTEALEVFLMENTERVSAFLGDDPYRLDERDAELWPVARIWQGAFDQAEARQREV